MSGDAAGYGQQGARRQPVSIFGRLAAQHDADKAQSMSKADQNRDRKLAEALRENLRRRKAQARDTEPQTKDENQAASE